MPAPLRATLMLMCLLPALLTSACGGGGGGAADSADFIVADPVGPQPEARARNVLLVVFEDLGPHTAAYGTPGVRTPAMDRVAAEGARYPRAYVSFPTCSASKAALLTGYYNHSSGAVGNVEEFVGPDEALAAANPSWYLDPNSAYNRYALDERIPTLVERARELQMLTGVQNKFHLSPHRKYPFDRWVPPGSPGYSIVKQFIDEAHSLQRPWLLVHNIGVSHRPYPDGDSTALDIDLSAIEVPAHLVDDATSRQDWAEYLQAIQYADARLADVLRALDESGDAGQTLLILIGDHGPAYHRGKFSSYQLGLQVPLIMRGPGISPGSVREELFSGVDLSPTIMEFLGRAIGSQGRSHASWLTGGSSDGAADVLVGQANSDRSISDGRYQLIFAPNPADTVQPADNTDFDPWRNRVFSHIVERRDDPAYAEAYRLLDLADARLTQYSRPRFELYDLHNDPWEVNDLAEDPSYRAVRDELARQLSEWMSAYHDPSERP